MGARGLCLAFLFLFLATLVSSEVESCDCTFHSHCESGWCNDDQCEYSRSGSSDPGCCSSNEECAAGFADDTELQQCLTANCYEDYFVCANIWNCTSFEPEERHTCSVSTDCEAYSTYCTTAACVGNYCFVSLVSPLRVGCCNFINGNSDCTEIPCMTARCDPDYYMCVYEPDESCSSSASDVPVPSMTPSATPAPSSPLPSPSSSGSETVSPTATQTPSTEPSASGSTSQEVPTASETETSTSTSTSSSTPTVSPEPTPSEVEESLSPSASEVISPSASVITTPEVTKTEVVGITEISSDDLDTGASFPWMWLFIILFGLILIGVVLIVTIGLVLRKRYLDKQFRPIELIDDDEFPM